MPIEITVASRRPWWLLGLAALVAIAAAGAVIALRGSSAPVAAGSPEVRTAQPLGAAARPSSDLAPVAATSAPSEAPAAAIAAAPPDPAAAAPPTGAPSAAAQITAELAVEPPGAQLSVDGQPVTLVAGRATIALAPGDHEALASAGGRIVRQRFTVAAGRATRVALRVPGAKPAATAPRTAPHAGDDVDGVEDPFRK